MTDNGNLQDNNSLIADIEPIKVIKSFYPLILLRKIYLSATLFSAKGLLDLAASGAFYFFLSIIPLALLFVFVLDISLAGYGNLSDYFFRLLGQLNPEISKDFFSQIGLLSSDKKSFFGIIGIVGLIWSSRSVFSSMRSVFEMIFNEGSKRNFIHDSLISLIFVPFIFVICIAFFVAGIVIRMLVDMFDKIGVTSFASPEAVGFYTSLINILILFLVTFAIYRFLPSKRPNSTDAVSGAVLFTLCAVIVQKGLYGVITIAKYYLVYGVISTLIVGLFWVYVLFTLFYLFAQFVYVQHMFPELEFNMYYNNVSRGKGSFIENLLFRYPDIVISKYMKTFKAGEILFKQGEKATALYILVEGSVSMLKRNATGIDTIIDIKAGETFGESGILSKSFYFGTASTKADSQIIVLPVDFYLRASNLDPQLSQTILNIYMSHNDNGRSAQPKD